MEFEPRTPMTAAELHVDFSHINTHIDERRAAVEHHATPAAKRLAAGTVELGASPYKVLEDLEARLRASLEATAEFGYLQARREIRSLRRMDFARAVADPGSYGERARGGLDGIRTHIRLRAREAATAVAAATTTAVNNQADPVLKAGAATVAAARALHNEVLTLVGETLNMGRTAGALSFRQPPEFALRSEQLDKATCDECERLHGTVVQVDTDAYYALLPPADCYGGGRCRGVMVFGDGPADVSQLEDAA
jgi:hypothetical protein